jgi:hypothetical protein
MITKSLVFVVAITALVHCSHEPKLTNTDSGKVLSERFYEVNGVRKVDQRILVTATPQLETRLVTKVLGNH